MRHGFDAYFGIPYSNDMGNVGRGQPPTPLMRNQDVVEAPCDQRTITRRYTDESINFVRRNREKPFFLYLAHTFPHVPLHASDEFAGKSPRGPYGDVVEELDANVGRLLQFLRDEKLAERTLVIFTSDNGPWLSQRENGGSAGLLRSGKTTTWEGGMRVPAIAWWPGRIKPGMVTRSHASLLDLLPTCAELAGAPLPQDAVLDGTSMIPMLFDGTPPPAPRPFFFYQGVNLNAVRRGPWKLHVRVPPPPTKVTPEEKQEEPPLLFHLERDPSERFNVAKDNADVVAELSAELDRHRRSIVPVKLQLEEWATTRPAQP
jgi:arylsulfatase A-like enzyme